MKVADKKNGGIMKKSFHLFTKDKRSSDLQEDFSYKKGLGGLAVMLMLAFLMGMLIFFSLSHSSCSWLMTLSFINYAVYPAIGIFIWLLLNSFLSFLFLLVSKTRVRYWNVISRLGKNLAFPSAIFLLAIFSTFFNLTASGLLFILGVIFICLAFFYLFYSTEKKLFRSILSTLVVLLPNAILVLFVSANIPASLLNQLTICLSY